MSAPPADTMVQSARIAAALEEGFAAEETDDIFDLDGAVGRSAVVSSRDAWDAPLPLDAVLAATGGKLGERHDFGTLAKLSRYVRQHARFSREPQDVVDPDAFDNTAPTRVILRCLGYLPGQPCLRLLLLHFCMASAKGATKRRRAKGMGPSFEVDAMATLVDMLETSSSDDDHTAPELPRSADDDDDDMCVPGPLYPELDETTAATVLNLLTRLYLDEHRVADSLEAAIRRFLFPPAVGRRLACAAAKADRGRVTVPGDTVPKRVPPLAELRAAMERRADIQVAARRLVGPVPALVVVPSQIRIAGYGLAVRGTLLEGTDVALYGGSRGSAVGNEANSGYRMAGPGCVVDALEERCLCSMANDAVYSPFTNNCGFRRSRSVFMRTLRTVHNEELFVPYGMGFALNFVDTMAAIAREHYPDFDRQASYTGVPSFGCPLGAEHAKVAAFEDREEAAAAEAAKGEDTRKVARAESSTRDRVRPHDPDGHEVASLPNRVRSEDSIES